MGTRLSVESPPNILSLQVDGDEDLKHKAECRVAGSPPPDIQWLAPEHPLKGSTTGPLSLGDDLIVSRQQDQVTCSASNPLGKDKATCFPFRPPTKDGAPPHILLLLIISLGSKVIMLLGIEVWLVSAGEVQ
ncbi:LOW QUALITY PROTEIN: V-set and Ig domain-containing protein [Hippocampus zosterae]|uniref:LOW QUALITY PROTEIN: V-set and Ig domain-containing protein n=1 Tax=Hippocampus zosterae TaxID=109293 RepID=UPI00223CD525|nr:LOW QUALITY PROTEIN: V-set and Ig domain-containing protein [Hippocampus zosterae]